MQTNTNNPYYQLAKEYKWSLLAEGLIKTYPTQVAVDRLYRYNYVSDVFVNGNKDSEEGAVQISVILNHTTTRANVVDLIREMDKMGYSKAYQAKLGNGSYKFIFEEKYPTNISTILRKHTNTLIHVTTNDKANKIKEVGFTPHTSQSKDFLDYQQHRTYFFTGEQLDQYQEDTLNNILDYKMGSYKQQHPDAPYQPNYVLIKVDLTKVPNTTRFYTDTMTYEAVYTIDNIPPTVIKSIEPLE